MKRGPLRITVRDGFRWTLGDADLRRVVSLRDGILEYEAQELGLEGDVIRVYRSPATIANVAQAMIGCPVTDGHLEVRASIPSAVRLGEVYEARAIDLNDEATLARLAVENLIKVGDGCGERWQAYRDEGREFSLGYEATLIPAGPGAAYDYEQREIEPHHLAVVLAGRCGPACTFVDARPVNKQEDEMKIDLKRFQDAKTGALSFADATLEELQAILSALPGALAKMDVAAIQKVTKPIMALAEAAGITAAPAAPAPEGEGMDQQSGEEQPTPGGTETPAADAAMVAKQVKDAVAGAIAKHTAVIERARLFVDAAYSFAGKSTEQIMRDVLSQERPGRKFSDEHLAVAFELLEPKEKSASNPYAKFGDSAANAIDDWFDKEV